MDIMMPAKRERRADAYGWWGSGRNRGFWHLCNEGWTACGKKVGQSWKKKNKKPYSRLKAMLASFRRLRSGDQCWNCQNMTHGKQKRLQENLGL
jgi:hypothetical protein